MSAAKAAKAKKSKTSKGGFGSKPSPELQKAFRAAGSADANVAIPAQRMFAEALTLPLQQGILNGDIVTDLYAPVELEPGVKWEMPLDFIAPGTEGTYIAYAIPNVGRIPERSIEGDYVKIPTYRIGASLDVTLRYLEEGRWDIAGRMLQVLEAMFTRKMNTDGWRVLLAAAKARNLAVYDNEATAGLFTKRVVSQLRTAMRRNMGGNSSSVNKGKLTDLFVSPECYEDMLNWDLSQVSDEIRTKIFLGGPLAQIGDISIHDLDELGEGQEFQQYYVNTLGGTMSGSKLEIVVGLDADNTKLDTLIMPIKKKAQIWEDPSYHRQGRASLYGWAEMGFGSCDSRRLILGQV